ncbi:PocR ligand-binding domain-containing protein [Clostridium chromiireducens]|uniref:histidine kinase n=1 Tax=Clostridium chromiireducens TaxID=225345 RepID=A0A1V4ICS9_9CLOT|nr:PocR ligand-binding domain-containing protein [Clostridium chromiireducens]OPJ57812.1 sensor histidine kinase YycG [Clostridium chromiireducens]
MFNFKELINIASIRKIAENIYAVAGIPIGIIGIDGNIEVAVGWQDICTKYHMAHKITCKNCAISNDYIRSHINKNDHIAYKCLNNMWDIAIPIILSDVHIATLFFGQFFYDDEVINKEYFRKQAQKYGFNEEEYLDALSRVPTFSREKVEHIIEYYKGLIMTMVESGMRQLEYENSQKKLQKSKKYLDTIFNLVNDAIYIGDLNGNILDVNETAVSMSSYSKEELLNINVGQIICFQELCNYANVSEIVAEVKKLDKLILEVICRRKDGSKLWVEASVRVINIDGDERILGTVRNITERKQAELTLKNEAIELERIRTEFFANISHELKTPLNLLLCTTKVINMNVQEKVINKEKITNNLNIQTQNCYRLIRLINNLIDFTKLDSGFLEINMVNCNIINVIEEIVLSVAEYTECNNINITFDTNIEEKVIACDLDKVERIMLNILSNATKFTEPGGSIFVRIKDGKEYITISVEDTGIGIPQDKVDIIFDRFRQVDKSFTRNQEGSGIGLSLAKSLLEMQGGSISAESKYGIGTKFILKFPVNVVDSSNSRENLKLIDNNLSNYIEKIRIEFSDIYAN